MHSPTHIPRNIDASFAYPISLAKNSVRRHEPRAGDRVLHHLQLMANYNPGNLPSGILQNTTIVQGGSERDTDNGNKLHCRSEHLCDRERYRAQRGSGTSIREGCAYGVPVEVSLTLVLPLV